MLDKRKKINLLQGDCLELMKLIPDNSIDMILTDPPYGTTACKWDSIISLELMWLELKRIVKVNGIRNHLNAKKQPMRVKEDVVVFYSKQPTYNPQMREGSYVSRKTTTGQSETFGKVSGTDSGRKVNGLYPIDILSINSHDPNNSYHPTQKPIALMEYLIKTYTDENETVLDFTMGGSTGVSCKNLKRKFIGIELDKKYFNIAKERIENE